MPERLQAWLDRYLHPREGWLAFGLLFVMLLSLGWSVQRAEWLDLLDFLVPVAFYALLLGTLLGISRLSVVITLPISAVVGAAIVLWAVGGEYFPQLTQGERLMELRTEAIDFTLLVIESGYGPQVTPYAIGLGVVMWVTAFIAGYTVYRHHRVLDAILLVGGFLIANAASIRTNLLAYLVIFSLAALLLWLRAALIGREEAWQRRRVTENAEVPQSIMRTGVAFVAVSIVVAWALTGVAVAAPLTAVWNNLDGIYHGVRDQLDGVLGGLSNPEARISGTVFGDGYSIRGEWFSSNEPVLTYAADRGYYLKTATYDLYTGRGFKWSGIETRSVDPGSLVFPEETPEQPLVPESFEVKTLQFSIQGDVGRNLFTPGYPTVTYVPMVVGEPQGGATLASLRSANPISPGQGYALTAAVSTATRAQLASAGTNYPPEISALYLDRSRVTEQVAQLAVQIVEEAGAANPYEQAEALATWLRTNPEFAYSASAPVPEDPERDIVDFFLFDPEGGRIGYCEYYATAMAVMARAVGLPSRVAVGYAPGEEIELPGGVGGGVFQVRQEDAHAWVEIYFPGYGWQIFEATKTIDPVIRPAGEAAPSGGSLGPAPSLPPLFDPGLGEEFALPSFDPITGGFRPGEEGPPPSDTRSGNLLIIVTIGLAILLLAVWRWRKATGLLRLLAPGDRQWRSLTLAADRAGISQRPSETIYEYAGWLEEQIPTRRSEIRTIARGKVWQSYSGHGLTGEALARIEEAWKRLQLPLVWLAIKRRMRALLPGR
ncbi:MAG TPA: transglutaminase domain-containing protein [candidate division Zixibacteria bacterium]|nr:transglutaminase domain-containing protein [candidate division Zixibacteria bacterium]